VSLQINRVGALKARFSLSLPPGYATIPAKRAINKVIWNSCAVSLSLGITNLNSSAIRGLRFVKYFNSTVT